ncbi:hypothetical protein GGI12_002934 [Dipsacomyces acuminosporus]|nr:hypothetical protein GGI12_002934 [Dipsacomyces acuminosporus]
MYSEIEQLLAQIQCETGDGIAEQTHRSRGDVLTGVGPIDDALKELEAKEGKRASELIVELVGLPGGGKTQSLYRICTTIAMPRAARLGSTAASASNRDAVQLHGCESHVVLVDADGKFDIALLRKYIYGQAIDAVRSNSSLGPSLASDAVADALATSAVNSTLARIHIFTPRSTHSLVATLALLPKYLSERDIAQPGALLIDGIGSNYWIDRKEGSLFKLMSKRATPWFRLQQLLVDTLQSVHRRLQCLVVVANLLVLRHNGASSSAKATSSPGPESSGGYRRVIAACKQEYKDHMIPRWPSILARSFVLESSVVSGHSEEKMLTSISFTPIDKQQQQQNLKQLPSQVQTVYVGDLGLRNTIS